MAELVRRYEPEIESIALLPSDGGRFEIEVNQKSLYSKLATGRHIEPAEVIRLLDEYLKGK